MTDDLNRTRQQLAQISSLWEELPAYLITGTPTSPEDADTPRQTQAGSKPPLNIHILDLITGSDLALWCLTAVDEWEDRGRHLTDLPDGIVNDTVPAMVAWLDAQAAWIYTAHPDYPADITRIHALYWQATGRPARRPWPCPDCKWDCDPQGDPDPQGKNPIHLCRGCGRLWRQKELEDRLNKHDRELQAIANDAVPLRYAAEQVGRSVATLKQWVKDGILEPFGFDRQRNCALYSLNHIRRLNSEKATRTRKVA